MNKRKNIDTIQDVLIDAPKFIRKAWKKIKKSYKNKKKFSAENGILVRSFLNCQMKHYNLKSKKLRRIVKAWKEISKSQKDL